MPERLGQHFLKNQKAAAAIINSLDLSPKDTVFEIGPGQGALTIPLLDALKKNGGSLVAIEKDPQLAAALAKKFETEPQIKVLNGDALQVLPKIIPEAIRPKLVGNIPYYITGRLLRFLSETRQPPIIATLMLQREVAERLVAKPPKSNLLGTITAVWADAEIVFRLHPKDFEPPPAVDSAVVKLLAASTIPPGKRSAFIALAKKLFTQPRKTIWNNLRGFGEERLLEKALITAKISPADRPQNLSLADIQRLEKSLRIKNVAVNKKATK